MTIRLIILLLLSSLVFYNCNPKSILSGPTPKADVDSVLFYQQNDLSDAFLDEIRNNPGNEAQLKTQLLPPPPPPEPNFREIEGFRVQVFAGSDSVGAASKKFQVATEVADSTYLLNERGLFKVQVGDYPYRQEADNMKLEMNNKGHSGAWVVKRKIYIPLDSTQIFSNQEQPVGTESRIDSTSEVEGQFKIQVLVTSDLLRAQELVSKLKNQFSKEAFYEQAGQVYKIFIGRFQTRADAEEVLDQVRQKGYPDAWLVY